MSTLMSKDLHINRSSTRLHAPPGGKSSLSLSDGTSSFNQFDRSPIPAKNNYSSYQTTNNAPNNTNSYPSSYAPSNAPNRRIPPSSSSSSSNTMMDPKLQQYMQTLSPEEKKIFESLVNEEMDKLSTDFKSTNMDSNSSSSYNNQYAQPQSQYSNNSMSSSLSNYEPTAPSATLHTQKQIKQQNQGGGGVGGVGGKYSDANNDSIMNIGTRKPPSGGSGGNNNAGRISSFSSGTGGGSSDEYMKKRLAQEAYSKQLTLDNNSKSNNSNDNSRFGNRQSSSRELQQRMVESNYVSPRSDLFSGLSAGSNKNKMSQQEYAQALQQDQYRNATIEPPRRTPLKKPNSDNDSNAYSNNNYNGSGYGSSSGGGASSGMAGMLSPTVNMGGGKPSAGFADTSNQRDKQQKYAYELAMDVQRKKEIQQDKERNQYTPNTKNNASSNNTNNYPPATNSNNYYEPPANSYNSGSTGSSYNYGGGSHASGSGDDRVKEYSSCNIPGLGRSVPSSNAPYGGGGGGNNDYDYVAHSPIYTSKAKAGGNIPMTDSIDYHLNSSSSNNNSRGGGGGTSYYAVGSDASNNNNNGGSGRSSNGNPIRSVSVGRGRSSGGGQSSIQLF